MPRVEYSGTTCPRGGNHDRWKPKNRPYHVVLEGSYVRADCDEISAFCNLNTIIGMVQFYSTLATDVDALRS
jgi:hypothetical protein